MFPFPEEAWRRNDQVSDFLMPQLPRCKNIRFSNGFLRFTYRPLAKISHGEISCGQIVAGNENGCGNDIPTDLRQESRVAQNKNKPRKEMVAGNEHTCGDE